MADIPEKIILYTSTIFTNCRADKIRLVKVPSLSKNIAYAMILMVKEGVLQWKSEI